MQVKEELILAEWLSPNHKLTEKELELLTCPLCYSLVREPVECSQCETMFCQSHAEKCLRSKLGCPACKMKPWRLKSRIHKAYNLLMQKIVLLCRCGKDINYIEIQTHPIWLHFDGKTEQPKEQSPKPTKQVKKDWPKFLFSYKNSGQWYAFNQAYNKVINQMLPALSFKIGRGDQIKSFDLGNMIMQEPYDSYKEYELRSEPYTDYIWRCFIKQQKAYHSYGRDINERIQQQYKKYKDKIGNPFIKVHYEEVTYQLNFELMEQINLVTGYRRPLTRTQW